MLIKRKLLGLLRKIINKNEYNINTDVYVNSKFNSENEEDEKSFFF